MNDYYCVLPFYSVETEFRAPNQNIFCCRLPPGTDIMQVRNAMLRQERSPSCSTCWSLESRGAKSERQIHNETLDYLLDLNIDNIEVASIANGFKPVKIKIATSNLCNGQCVTCNSGLSTAWAALEGSSSQYKGMDIDALNVDWANIVSLSFVGGEPLLEKKNFKILQQLIDLGNTDCFISIVTNGSIELSQHQLEILGQFKKLNICVSIDGTGKSFEYMRFPLKWNRLVNNLKLFKQLTNSVSVSCMVSNLNIYYYSEFVNFFKDNDLNYLCKQVTDPAIFSPANLPPSAKAAVRNNNKQYAEEVELFLGMPSGYDINRFEMLKRNLAKQEQLKKIALVDYMPEVANFL